MMFSYQTAVSAILARVYVSVDVLCHFVNWISWMNLQLNITMTEAFIVNDGSLFGPKSLWLSALEKM